MRGMNQFVYIGQNISFLERMSSKKKCLSIKEKLKILKEVDNGASRKEIIWKFHLPKSTLSEIIKKQEATDDESPQASQNSIDLDRVIEFEKMLLYCHSNCFMTLKPVFNKNFNIYWIFSSFRLSNYNSSLFPKCH